MNLTKYRFMTLFLSGALITATMSMPAHAMEIETTVNENETVWDIIAQTEMDSEETVLLEKENKLETAIKERIIDIIQEEEEPEEEKEPETLYIPRLTAPEGNNPYYHELNLFYNFGLGMPNCTAYAYGRAYEILGREPNLSNGNAGRWWWHNIATGAYAYGSEPRLGAVACWDDYNEYSGHVAVVEEINGSTVTISESHYGGGYFYVTDMSADGSDYLTGRRFLGYIYIDEPIEEK